MKLKKNNLFAQFVKISSVRLLLHSVIMPSVKFVYLNICCFLSNALYVRENWDFNKILELQPTTIH